MARDHQPNVNLPTLTVSVPASRLGEGEMLHGGTVRWADCLAGMETAGGKRPRDGKLTMMVRYDAR